MLERGRRLDVNWRAIDVILLLNLAEKVLHRVFSSLSVHGIDRDQPLAAELVGHETAPCRPIE